MATASLAQPARAQRKGVGLLSRIVSILLGLLLIAFGLRGPILDIAGASTMATVTGVAEGEEDFNYTVSYRFTVHRTPYSGTMGLEAYNSALIPEQGSLLAVRYLPLWPTINAAGKASGLGLGHIAAVVAGIVLIAVSGRVAWRFGASGDD